MSAALTIEDYRIERINRLVAEILASTTTQLLIKDAAFDLSRHNSIVSKTGEFISQRSAAEILGHSQTFVRTLIDKHKLNTYTQAHLLSKDEVLAWKAKLERKASVAAATKQSITLPDD